MNGYLIDTDILIEILRAHPAATERLRDADASGIPVMIHALTYYETKRGLVRAGATRQLTDFEQLCDRIAVVQLSRASLDMAVSLYDRLAAEGHLIGDADILIAASALVENLVVVTHNTQHFGRVPHLAVEDWIVSV